MRMQGFLESTLEHLKWSVYKPIINYHHDNGTELCSDDLLNRMCEKQAARYEKGEISRKRYREFLTATFRIRSYVDTGEVDYSIVKDTKYYKPGEEYQELVDSILKASGLTEGAVYNGLAGKREWFFQYPDGGQIPTRWAQWHFSKAWRKSTLFSRGNKPRPYDLRHNFATRTLMRWIDEGRDVMALMPYLSTYMGHVSLEETLYYIHLLPERLKSSPGIDWKMLDDIYQTEEGSDEED